MSLCLADHVCHVIDAFVEKLVMSELGFERAQAAETGRPGYNPRDLLKLYLCGSLNQIRRGAWKLSAVETSS
jgi:transposase